MAAAALLKQTFCIVVVLVQQLGSCGIGMLGRPATQSASLWQARSVPDRVCKSIFGGQASGAACRRSAERRHFGRGPGAGHLTRRCPDRLMRSLLTPRARAVTRPVSVLLLIGWVAVMAVLINRSYLQASTSLAADLARYGSAAVWRGVY